MACIFLSRPQSSAIHQFSYSAGPLIQAKCRKRTYYFSISRYPVFYFFKTTCFLLPAEISFKNQPLSYGREFFLKCTNFRLALLEQSRASSHTHNVKIGGNFFLPLFNIKIQFKAYKLTTSSTDFFRFLQKHYNRISSTIK